MKEKHLKIVIQIFNFLLAAMLIGTIFSACQNQSSEYFTEADFKTINKIDIHCHINTKNPAFMEQAVEDNFRILLINVDAFETVPIKDQRDLAIYQKNAFSKNLEYITTFSIDGWDDEDWVEKTISYLEDSFKNGAIGVKVWKNIGMVEKDKNDEFIMIDNPKFDPVFSFLAEKGVPLIGHLGEPRNCWLPLEEMTVNNDKSYFKDHPEYHMYLHPEFPSYEEQMNARNNMLAKNPNLIFIGAHLASLEWSIDEVSGFLDKFPNSTVDLAERLSHLQVQAINDWEKVRNFFIEYQDRIIYGSDKGDFGLDQDPAKLKQLAHEEWITDWRFLTSNETMSAWQVNGEFKGLRLPKVVIEKIYYKNAERIFPEFRQLVN